MDPSQPMNLNPNNLEGTHLLFRVKVVGDCKTPSRVLTERSIFLCSQVPWALPEGRRPRGCWEATQALSGSWSPGQIPGPSHMHRESQSQGVAVRRQFRE